MRVDKKQKGQNIIAWLVVTPFALIILGVLLCEANKAYWDYRVTKMCEEDGGVEIFEHIEVTPEEFEKLPILGKGIGFRDKKFAIPSDIIFSVNKYSILQSHFPRVEYSEVTIKRLADEKVIARYLTAARIGGDFPSPAHSSSLRCPSIEGLGIEIQNIFTIKDD